MSASKHGGLLVCKAGHDLDVIMHNVSKLYTKDISLDGGVAAHFLSQILDETPSIVAFHKFNVKKRKWFTVLKNVWVDGNKKQVKAKGVAYAATFEMSICLAYLKFKGLKVKEYLKPFPSNPRMADFVPPRLDK